jgi:hypothetical protein
MIWRNWWNDDWQGKPKYSEKTCPSAALSTTNPTCYPEANPGRRGGKSATNRLSYGRAKKNNNTSSDVFDLKEILSLLFSEAALYF